MLLGLSLSLSHSSKYINNGVNVRKLLKTTHKHSRANKNRVHCKSADEFWHVFHILPIYIFDYFLNFFIWFQWKMCAVLKNLRTFEWRMKLRRWWDLTNASLFLLLYLSDCAYYLGELSHISLKAEATAVAPTSGMSKSNWVKTPDETVALWWKTSSGWLIKCLFYYQH